MSDQEVSRDDRLLGALAYPLWWAVFPLILLAPGKKERKFIRYHAYQGLFLGLLFWVGGITLWTAAAIIGRITIIGVLIYPIVKLTQWASLLTTVYAFCMAWLGLYVQIPFVTEFARPFSQKAE